MPPMTPENVAIGRIVAGSVYVIFPRFRRWLVLGAAVTGAAASQLAIRQQAAG